MTGFYMKATLTWYRLLPKIFLIGILKKSRRLEHWELEQWDRTLNNIILQNVKTVQDSPKPSEGPFKRWRDQICDCFGLIILTVWKVSKCRAFFGPYFPVFGLNTGKHGPEKTPYLDSFHAVSKTWI